VKTSDEKCVGVSLSTLLHRWGGHGLNPWILLGVLSILHNNKNYQTTWVMSSNFPPTGGGYEDKMCVGKLGGVTIGRSKSGVF
jgi:hypothetical protein